MQDPQHLVRILHVPDVGVPGPIQQPIAEAGDNETDHKERIRRVAGSDDVAD